jgi:hypothetical protein
VKLGAMRVSPEAQRHKINRARVALLVANLDLEQIGNPHLNERDGHFFIIDGMHRIEAYKRWVGDGWETQELQCWTYVGLTEQEEANKFDLLNNVLRVSAYDTYRVRRTAGRPIETEIDRIVRAQGLVVSLDSSLPGAIGCVSTLRKVLTRSDGPTLGRTLRIIRDAYGDPGFQGPVIDGIGLLCQRFNGELPEPVAVEKLGGARGGVNGLLNQAEVLRRKTGNYKSHCVAAAAVEIINTGRNGKRLPSWWKEAK